MRRSYSVSSVHKLVLNFVPRREICLKNKLDSDLKSCSGRIVFLWFKNCYGTWYHIISVRGTTLFGYMMTNNRWQYRTVQIRQISCYY